MATSPKPDGPSLRIIVESLMMMTKQIKLKKLNMVGQKIHLRLPIFSSVCVIFSAPIGMAQSALIDHRSLLHILVAASRKALHHSLTHVLAYAYLVRLHSSPCGNPISACTFQRLPEEARDWFGSFCDSRRSAMSSHQALGRKRPVQAVDSTDGCSR